MGDTVLCVERRRLGESWGDEVNIGFLGVSISIIMKHSRLDFPYVLHYKGRTPIDVERK